MRTQRTYQGKAAAGVEKFRLQAVGLRNRLKGGTPNFAA